MISKEAIVKAIEGGWKPQVVGVEFIRKIMPKTAQTVDREILQENWHRIALDPSFWRSLETVTGKTARAAFLDFCSAVWDAETDEYWAKMQL